MAETTDTIPLRIPLIYTQPGEIQTYPVVWL